MAKRNELSLNQKVQVLEALKCKNQIQVAAEFGISQSAVSRIKCRERDIFLHCQEMPDRERTRRIGKYTNNAFDLTLLKFSKEQVQTLAGNPVTTQMLKENASTMGSSDYFACSEASTSWLSQWKQRHNLDLQRSNTSSHYTPQVPGVPTQTGAPVQKQPLTLPPPPLKKPVPSPLQASKPPPPPRPVSPPQPPPPPPEVCLRWNSYHSNMQATFPSLLNNEQFVDVTLACEGRSIKCHKMMLSACSAYFEELLSQNPCQHPIVLMKDLRYWEVQALVDFMYRGEVNVGQDKLPSLLAAAEALQIKGLAGPASTSSSHDEDSLPPSVAMGSAEDFMDESTPSPSSSRRARKRRAMGSAPIPQPQPQPVPVATSRNPVGRPRLSRTSAPLPSTSSYHQESSHSSEPPARRVCKPDTSNIMSEIKIEPIDIDIRSESMDPGDDSYMDKEAFDESTTADGGESSGQGDGGGGGENSVDHDTMLHGHVDRKTILHGHDSEQLNYGNNNGNNNGMTSDSTGNDSKLQGYPYEPGNGPESSSPAYPEVVMNPGGDNTLDQC